MTLEKNRNTFAVKDEETRTLKNFSSIFEEGDGLVFVRFVKPLKLKINKKSQL